jgi:hypothetical protein
MKGEDGERKQSRGGGEEASEGEAGEPNGGEVQEKIDQVEAGRPVAVKLEVGPEGEVGEGANAGGLEEVEGPGGGGEGRVGEERVVVQQEATADGGSEGQRGREQEKEGLPGCYAL